MVKIEEYGLDVADSLHKIFNEECAKAVIKTIIENYNTNENL